MRQTLGLCCVLVDSCSYMLTFQREAVHRNQIRVRTNPELC